MLTPDYLAHCSDTIVAQYENLHEQITQDICRRVMKTGEMTYTAAWQAKMLQESGKLFDDIVADVAKTTGRSNEEIARLFNEAGVLSVKYDAEPLVRAGLKVETGLSPSMQQILEANAKVTQGEFSNLCMTTASVGQEGFIEAMNEAVMMVESGAFDPDTALRRVIDKAPLIGGSVMYPSGNTMSLEAAARMNIMTAVNHTVGKITEMNAERLGCQHYETSAHVGARPTHAEWQGQVFRIEGADSEYDNFYDATGYGEPDGLCGCNCRHSFYPYFPGISERNYSDEELEDLADRKVEYNGVEYSDYEASQIQRRYERAIRESKQKVAGYDEAIKNASTDESKRVLEEGRLNAKKTLNDRRQRLTDFTKQTGSNKEYIRMKTSGTSSYSKPMQAPKIGMDVVRNNISTNVAEGMKAKMEQAPENIQKVWAKNESKLAVRQKNAGEDTCYKPSEKKVLLDFANDITGKGQNDYAVPFHEFAHMIDNLMGKIFSFSNEYEDGIFEKAIREETNALFDSYKARKLKEFSDGFEAGVIKRAEGLVKRGLATDAEAKEYITYTLNKGAETVFKESMQSQSFKENAVKELMEELTSGKKIREVVPLYDTMGATMQERLGVDVMKLCGGGHEAAYWINNEGAVARELFAELFSASVVDAEQYAFMKELMPRSVGIFETMIEKMAV
jgi:hypothetical protein